MSIQVALANRIELNKTTITAWRNIDQGIRESNQTLILSGNEALLQREQQQVLANGYATLYSMTGITTVMSILAECPVWNPSTSEPYYGRDFLSVVGIGHNLAIYTDRWNWVTYPTIELDEPTKAHTVPMKNKR